MTHLDSPPFHSLVLPSHPPCKARLSCNTWGEVNQIKWDQQSPSPGTLWTQPQLWASQDKLTSWPRKLFPLTALNWSKAALGSLVIPSQPRIQDMSFPTSRNPLWTHIEDTILGSREATSCSWDATSQPHIQDHICSQARQHKLSSKLSLLRQHRLYSQLSLLRQHWVEALLAWAIAEPLVTCQQM